MKDRAWLMFEGAASYARALITGNRRSDEEVERVAKVCASCVEKRGQKSILGPTLVFCGEPAWHKTRSNPKTCGCLLFYKAESPTSITINGERYKPIAKLLVAEESCPLGYWS